MSHPSWHGNGCFNILKGHQWMITMYSSMCMKSKLKSGKCRNHPNIMAPNVTVTSNIVVTISNSNLANANWNGNKTSIGSGGVWLFH
jgi:hypothetical protein